MSLTLKVYCEPGSDITDAFQEATELANKLNMAVEFRFNEVICWAKPGGRVSRGVEEYHEAIKAESKLKYARNY